MAAIQERKESRLNLSDATERIWQHRPRFRCQNQIVKRIMSLALGSV